MKKIWLTRPRQDSEALAAALNIPTIIAPVMQIVPYPIADMGPKPDGIILTSRHGLYAALPNEWRQLPVYCVGEATAQAAKNGGFTRVIECGGDALALVKYVSEVVPAGTNLLYICGEETRIEITTLLGAKGIPVRSLTAYSAVAEDGLSEGLIQAIKNHEIGGVVFFSPRSAAITGELLHKADLVKFAAEIDAYCLSVTVAAEAGATPWKSLKAARSPSTASMLELLNASAIEEA